MFSDCYQEFATLILLVHVCLLLRRSVASFKLFGECLQVSLLILSEFKQSS